MLSTNFEAEGIRDEFVDALKELLKNPNGPVFLTRSSGKSLPVTDMVLHVIAPHPGEFEDSVVYKLLKERDERGVWNIYTLEEVKTGKAPFSVSFETGIVSQPPDINAVVSSLNYTFESKVFNKKGLPKNKPWYQQFDKSRKRY